VSDDSAAVVPAAIRGATGVGGFDESPVALGSRVETLEGIGTGITNEKIGQDGLLIPT
jgi:hypothetical protein